MALFGCRELINIGGSFLWFGCNGMEGNVVPIVWHGYGTIILTCEYTFAWFVAWIAFFVDQLIVVQGDLNTGLVWYLNDQK